MKEIIEFTYQDHGVDPYYNVKHSHGDCYEIIFVCAGDGSFLVRDLLFPIQPSCIYFINGIDVHCSIPIAPECYQRRKLIVSAKYMDDFLKSINCLQLTQALFKNKGGSFFRLNEERFQKIEQEFSFIKEILTDASPYASAVVLSSSIKILHLAQTETVGQEHIPDSRVRTLLEYINRNLGNKLTLDELCHQVHLNKSYLCRLFKSVVGMSVFDYILSRRISTAKKLLLFSELSITEIVITTGFPSFSYFVLDFFSC